MASNGFTRADGSGDSILENLSTISLDELLHTRDEIDDLLRQCAVWLSIKDVNDDANEFNRVKQIDNLSKSIPHDLRSLWLSDHSRKVLQILSMWPQGIMLDGLDPNQWLKSQIRSGWGN